MLNNCFKCNLFLWWQSWSFRNHSNTLICCSRNILSSLLKTVVLFFFVVVLFFCVCFRILWWIESSEAQHLSETQIFRNIKTVFSVTFHKLNVSSLNKSIRARFIEQGKLAQERNSKTAQMGMKISASDLLTMHKLKNTDATSHLHIDQRNIPSVAQISIVTKKQRRCSSGVGDLLTTQAQNSLRHAFFGR